MTFPVALVFLLSWGLSLSPAQAAPKNAAKKSVQQKFDPSSLDPEAAAPVRNAVPAPIPAVPPASLYGPSTHSEGPLPPPLSTEHLFGFDVAVGFPHPTTFGLFYVLPSKFMTAELSGGNYSMTVDSVRARIQNYDVALRWHPFAGAFFLGGIYGTQKITGDKTDPTYGFTGSAEVKSTYFTPNLGWIWGTGGKGVFASFEVGYQFPSNVTTNFTSDADSTQQNTQEYQDLQTKVRDNAEKIGKTGVPYVSLLKIGFLF